MLLSKGIDLSYASCIIEKFRNELYSLYSFKNVTFIAVGRSVLLIKVVFHHTKQSKLKNLII